MIGVCGNPPRNLRPSMLTFTPWLSGPPARPGLYVASTERNESRRAFWDGLRWSEGVDEAASEVAHDTARATPMCPERQRAIEWRGLTERSAASLTAEMEREPLTA